MNDIRTVRFDSTEDVVEEFRTISSSEDEEGGSIIAYNTSEDTPELMVKAKEIEVQKKMALKRTTTRPAPGTVSKLRAKFESQ